MKKGNFIRVPEFLILIFHFCLAHVSAALVIMVCCFVRCHGSSARGKNNYQSDDGQDHFHKTRELIR